MKKKNELPPGWRKNKFGAEKGEVYFTDGDEFLIALQVTNNKTGAEVWEFAHVVADCDGENFHLRSVVEGERAEYFDSWTWFDVEYYIPINSNGPMTKAQCEAAS